MKSANKNPKLNNHVWKSEYRAEAATSRVRVDARFVIVSFLQACAPLSEKLL